MVICVAEDWTEVYLGPTCPKCNSEIRDDVEFCHKCNFNIREWKRERDELMKNIKSTILVVVEDIKNKKYKLGVQKLVEIEQKIEQNLRETDRRRLPECYLKDDFVDDWCKESIILKILWGEFSETWDDYYELLKEMSDTGFLRTISSRYPSVWIDANSILSNLLETLIINEKIDCAEILCNDIYALIEAGTVLKIIGLSKKYMEALNAKTKEFDEKIKKLKEHNKLDFEKAKVIIENSIRKYCPPNISSDIIIKSIPSYKITYDYLLSGEAFIDFCEKNLDETKGFDFSGPCVYYFKAIETFMCDRIREIIKPNPIEIDYHNYSKSVKSNSSEWNKLSVGDYERIIVKILKPGTPFSKKIAGPSTSWRTEVRNSKVHKEQVSDFNEVLKVKAESYKFLCTLFSILVKENIKESYVR